MSLSPVFSCSVCCQTFNVPNCKRKLTRNPSSVCSFVQWHFLTTGQLLEAEQECSASLSQTLAHHMGKAQEQREESWP